MDRFCWQYMQLEQKLDYPPPAVLRTEQCQTELYRRLFAQGALPHPPPARYQLGVLKGLVGRIERSIDDWDAHGISEDLACTLTDLLARPTPAPSDTLGAGPSQQQQRTAVTYHLSRLSGRSVTLLEARHLISAGGTTGLRTWEAALHLGQYLCARHDDVVAGRRVLELGAGTGYLAVLCARHLGARQVLATDGSTDVVAALHDALALNGAAAHHQAAVLRWGLDRCPGPVDLVLGADVTYDAALVPPLVATLAEALEASPAAEVLMAATERNRATFDVFLDAVAAHPRLAPAEMVDFAVDGDSGPFFESSVPIHICRIRAR